MDKLAATAKKIELGDAAAYPVLSMYCQLYDRLTGVPRFLLDYAAAATAVELSLGRPKIILEAMAHLQVPYKTMWIEWEEVSREKLREEIFDKFGLTREVAGRPMPERLGFLIETDGNGRKGVVTWLWTFKGFEEPEIGFVSAYFDLDASFEQVEGLSRQFLGGNLARLWDGNPVQMDALLKIWQTAEHKISDWGERHLAHIAAVRGCNQNQLLSIIENGYADVYGEYIMVWAMLLLLTASRPVVEYRKVDRGKLNKTRLRTNKAPLLDHTEVVLHIGDRVKHREPRGTLGYARKPPRIHMVSRYLARRGNKHWLVNPYMRGAGDIIHRRVQVKR